MDLRAARLALADLLIVETKVTVIPHPPRVTNTPVTIFFGAMSGNRETQDGGELATIPVLVLIPATTNDQYDVLDEFIDGPKSIVDIIDANPNPVDDVTFSISGEWSIELAEVAGTSYLAAVFKVEARF